MRKFGLKLWSINRTLANEAAKLFNFGTYDFIELYSVPDSYSDTISIWKSLDIPFMIHASHFPEGINFAKAENKNRNLELMDETRRFADALNADIIIAHPGTDGEEEEVVRQLDLVKDPRIIIENKPFDSIYDGLKSNGSTPEQIKKIMKGTGFGFCMDMGHAICSANSHGKEPGIFLRKFMELEPRHFHLSDGDRNAFMDSHQHFGAGNFPIKELMDMIPVDGRITIETKKDSLESLDDFAGDVEYLKRLS